MITRVASVEFSNISVFLVDIKANNDNYSKNKPMLAATIPLIVYNWAPLNRAYLLKLVRKSLGFQGFFEKM